MSSCFVEMKVQRGYNLKHKKKHKRVTTDRPKPQPNAFILLKQIIIKLGSFSLSDALNDELKCQCSAPKT